MSPIVPSTQAVSMDLKYGIVPCLPEQSLGQQGSHHHQSFASFSSLRMEMCGCQDFAKVAPVLCS